MTTTLSRDAQLAASTFFLTGANNQVSFSTKTIAKRTQDAMNELLEAKMVKLETHRDIITYISLPAIGRPYSDFQPPQQHECWNITNRVGK